jgi:TP901 family phage tail tape measure protein
LRLNINDRGFTQPLGKMTRSASEFQKSLEASNSRVLAFGASVGVMNAVANSVKFVASEAVKLEKSLADVNVVLNVGQKSLQGFRKELFTVARETAQPFEEVTKAALEFSRQGLSMEETLRRVRDAMVLTRLTGIGAASSVDGLTAAVNSFADTKLNTTEIINKLAAVDVAFAVSSEDLIEGIKRSASSAQSAGVSFDQLIAAITSAQQITARGGAVIGNSFKTIFTRVQRSTTLDKLEELGIVTKDIQGNTLPAITVLKNLSDTYDQLSDSAKSYISEAVGSVFQINILKAALKDLGSDASIFAGAVDVSSKATDQAIQKNVQLNQTIDALFKSSIANVQELSGIFGQLAIAPVLRDVLQLLEGATNAAKGFFGDEGEESGNQFAIGFAKSVAQVLSGPALVGIGAIIIKLLLQLGKFARESLAEILKSGQAAKKIEEVQKAIEVELRQNKALHAEILKLEGNKEAQAKKLLTVITRTTDELQQQQALTRNIARGLYNQGVSVGKDDHLTVGRRPRFRNAASGYLPDEGAAVIRERMAIQAGVGGASPNAKPITVKGFNLGGGRRTSIVANDEEYHVKNYAGSGKDAIFTKAMIRDLGRPDNAQRINAAGGLFPFGLFDKNPQRDYNSATQNVGKALARLQQLETSTPLEVIENERLSKNVDSSSRDRIKGLKSDLENRRAQNLKSIGSLTKNLLKLTKESKLEEDIIAQNAKGLEASKKKQLSLEKQSTQNEKDKAKFLEKNSQIIEREKKLKSELQSIDEKRKSTFSRQGRRELDLQEETAREELNSSSFKNVQKQTQAFDKQGRSIQRKINQTKRSVNTFEKGRLAAEKQYAKTLDSIKNNEIILRSKREQGLKAVAAIENKIAQEEQRHLRLRGRIEARRERAMQHHAEAVERGTNIENRANKANQRREPAIKRQSKALDSANAQLNRATTAQAAAATRLNQQQQSRSALLGGAAFAAPLVLPAIGQGISNAIGGGEDRTNLTEGQRTRQGLAQGGFNALGAGILLSSLLPFGNVIKAVTIGLLGLGGAIRGATSAAKLSAKEIIAREQETTSRISEQLDAARRALAIAGSIRSGDLDPVEDLKARREFSESLGKILDPSLQRKLRDSLSKNAASYDAATKEVENFSKKLASASKVSQIIGAVATFRESPSGLNAEKVGSVLGSTKGGVGIDEVELARFLSQKLSKDITDFERGRGSIRGFKKTLDSISNLVKIVTENAIENNDFTAEEQKKLRSEVETVLSKVRNRDLDAFTNQGTIKKLKEAAGDVRGLLTQLAEGGENVEAINKARLLNVGDLIIQGVVDNSAKVISSRITEFTELSKGKISNINFTSSIEEQIQSAQTRIFQNLISPRELEGISRRSSGSRVQRDLQIQTINIQNQFQKEIFDGLRKSIKSFDIRGQVQTQLQRDFEVDPVGTIGNIKELLSGEKGFFSQELENNIKNSRKEAIAELNKYIALLEEGKLRDLPKKIQDQIQEDDNLDVVAKGLREKVEQIESTIEADLNRSLREKSQDVANTLESIRKFEGALSIEQQNIIQGAAQQDVRARLVRLEGDLLTRREKIQTKLNSDLLRLNEKQAKSQINSNKEVAKLERERNAPLLNRGGFAEAARQRDLSQNIADLKKQERISQIQSQAEKDLINVFKDQAISDAMLLNKDATIELAKINQDLIKTLISVGSGAAVERLVDPTNASVQTLAEFRKRRSNIEGIPGYKEEVSRINEAIKTEQKNIARIVQEDLAKSYTEASDRMDQLEQKTASLVEAQGKLNNLRKTGLSILEKEGSAADKSSKFRKELENSGINPAKIEDLIRKFDSAASSSTIGLAQAIAEYEKTFEDAEDGFQKTVAKGSFAVGRQEFVSGLNTEIDNFEAALGRDIPNAFRDGMVDAIGLAINKTDDLRSALLGVANAFLQTVQQAFIRNAVNRTISNVPFLQNFNSGGPVKGGVPAMVSNGEYRMSAKAVNRVGLGTMHAINKGTLPKFNSGGQVGNTARSAYQRHIDTFGTAFTNDKSSAFFNSLYRNVPKAQREIALKNAAGQEALAAAQAKRAEKDQLRSTLLGLGLSAGLAFGTSRIGSFFQRGGKYSGGIPSTIASPNLVGPRRVDGSFHDGGMIRGPSGRDVIPIMAEDQEFVIQKSAVQKYGKRFLDSVNTGKFNSGGQVGASSSSTPVSNSSGQTFNLNMNFDLSNGDGNVEAGEGTQTNDVQNLKVFTERIRDIVSKELRNEMRVGGLLRQRR